MLPTAAVSGFYFAHPESQYFGVATIGRDQVADYAERRGIEIVDEGAPRTPFMAFGDTVRMEGRLPEGRSPFGVIEQKVVKA